MKEHKHYRPDPKKFSADLSLIEFHCSSCGEYFLFEDLIEELVSGHFEWDTYIAHKEGGDFPVTACHECGKVTYIVEEDKCVACGAIRHYLECSVCSHSLSTEEQDFGGLCAYHHHQLTKDGED